MKQTAAILTACLLLLLAACGGGQETGNPSVRKRRRNEGRASSGWNRWNVMIKHCIELFRTENLAG